MQEFKSNQESSNSGEPTQRNGVALSKKSASGNDVIQRYWIERDDGTVEWTGTEDNPPKQARFAFERTGKKKYKYNYLPVFLNTQLDIWKKKPTQSDEPKPKPVDKGKRRVRVAPSSYEQDQAASSSYSFEDSSVARRIRPIRSDEARSALETAGLNSGSKKDDLYQELVRVFGQDRVDATFKSGNSIRQLFIEDELDVQDQKDDGDEKVDSVYGRQWDINDVQGIGGLDGADRDRVQLRIDEANYRRRGYNGHVGVGDLWTMDITGTNAFGGNGRGDARLQFNYDGTMRIVDHDGRNLL